jgi:hypothetical protein
MSLTRCANPGSEAIVVVPLICLSSYRTATAVASHLSTKAKRKKPTPLPTLQHPNFSPRIKTQPTAAVALTWALRSSIKPADPKQAQQNPLCRGAWGCVAGFATHKPVR